MLFDNSLHDIERQFKEHARKEKRLYFIAVVATLLGGVAIGALVHWF
ncbi:hypothetical protein WKW79_35605 [Variovorax robiniae]|uniref:Uncharacterized protein n=1 Tax=Variovorax robiniae TaxID=1836199 RepID=A0ABU8XJQ2_9BURK